MITLPSVSETPSPAETRFAIPSGKPGWVRCDQGKRHLSLHFVTSNSDIFNRRSVVSRPGITMQLFTALPVKGWIRWNRW
jgi:hypothetical protein